MLGVIDIGYKNCKQFLQQIDEIIEVECVSIFDFKASDLKKWTGIIITNGQLSVYDQDISPYLEKLAPLKTANIPLLGLGAGHHLVGVLFEAIRSYQIYTVGFQQISVLEDSPLFDRLPDEVEVYSDHVGTISIPPHFKLIASSDKSINEAMEHMVLPVFGVQCSPDLSGNHGIIILENFVHFTEAFNRKKGDT